MTKRERDALEFYADPENWKTEVGRGQWRGSSRARGDAGLHAREALEKKPRSKTQSKH